ncbi:MAG TPA: MFS transporter [Bryobacteraceae bacterium]|nr:MFS transporter [Bryobacteraceae bacterium]
MPPRKWAVVALLSAGMVIAYIDRANLSVVLATAEVRDALHLSDAARGLLNSAFFWSYALLQIPAGWIVDRYGVRKPYAIGFLFWTMVSAATGLVTHVSQLVAVRLLLGAGEAVGAPASLRWIRWNCPEERRGLAIGIYFAGTKIGSALGVPLAAFLITAFSWRTMFVICGLAGLVWLLGWLLLASDATPQEISTQNKQPEVAISFSHLLASPVVWGILIGTFSYGYFLYFCVTWLPAYLVEYRRLALNSMGFYALFSFGGMALVAVFAGWLADHVIRRGADPARTRKAFTILGFLLASTEVIGAVSNSESVALFFVVFSLAGLGLATANYWALTQTLIPGKAMGRIAGIQNCASNLGGVAAPILTGWLKQASGGYRAPMQAIWIVLLLGIASYVFLVRLPDRRKMAA